MQCPHGPALVEGYFGGGVHCISLLPHLHCDPDMWVDASMSWGIGLVVNSCWAAWQPLDGWKEAGHDIGWAEMTTMELAL